MLIMCCYSLNEIPLKGSHVDFVRAKNFRNRALPRGSSSLETRLHNLFLFLLYTLCGE